MNEFILIGDLKIILVDCPYADKISRRFNHLKASLCSNNKKILTISFKEKRIADTTIEYSYGNLAHTESSVLVACSDKKYIELKSSLAADRINVVVDKDVKQHELESFLENILFILFIEKGVSPIHSIAYKDRDKGYLVAAKGGVGKTRLLLEAMSQNDGVDVSDEWSLLTNQTVFPWKKDIVLMYYDILAYPSFVTLFDRMRAKVYSSIKWFSIRLVIERLKLGLKYKVYHYKAPQSFQFDRLVLLRRYAGDVVVVSSLALDNACSLICNDFFREKHQLFTFANVHDFVFKNNTLNLKSSYENGLRTNISQKKLFSVFTPARNSSAEHIYEKIKNEY